MSDPAFVNYGASNSVTDAVTTRRSIRGFLPDPVDQNTLADILQKAARAPSGTNMQPWQVYVMSGDRKLALCDAVCRAFDEDATAHTGEVRYYPEQWFDPYLGRRRKVGWSLYDLLSIKKGEREKTTAQHRRNFVFFDAPVGLIFTIHRDLATGSWLDYGMFLQNLMVLAREAGLHTCAQAAWSDFHSVIRPELSLADHEVVVCGMAVGFADPALIENSLVTERCELNEFVTFLK